MDRCPDCDGYGYIATEPNERNEFRFVDCDVCGGSGSKESADQPCSSLPRRVLP